MFPGNAGAVGISLALNRHGRSPQRRSGISLSESTIPQEIAWRIFTKGIDRESALSQVKVTGQLRWVFTSSKWSLSSPNPEKPGVFSVFGSLTTRARSLYN